MKPAGKQHITVLQRKRFLKSKKLPVLVGVEPARMIFQGKDVNLLLIESVVLSPLDMHSTSSIAVNLT